MKQISCREFIDFMTAFFEGTLTDAERTEFDRHMEECPYCVDYMKSYRQTIEQAKALADDDAAPEDAPEELIRAILAAKKRL